MKCAFDSCCKYTLTVQYQLVPAYVQRFQEREQRFFEMCKSELEIISRTEHHKPPECVPLEPFGSVSQKEILINTERGTPAAEVLAGTKALVEDSAAVVQHVVVVEMRRLTKSHIDPEATAMNNGGVLEQ